MSYADAALEAFPLLLVELVRSNATQRMLRDEGFRSDEIAAVRALVALSNREEVDARRTAERDADGVVGNPPAGEAVTALSG